MSLTRRSLFRGLLAGALTAAASLYAPGVLDAPAKRKLRVTLTLETQDKLFEAFGLADEDGLSAELNRMTGDVDEQMRRAFHRGKLRVSTPEGEAVSTDSTVVHEWHRFATHDEARDLLGSPCVLDGSDPKNLVAKMGTA